MICWARCWLVVATVIVAVPPAQALESPLQMIEQTATRVISEIKADKDAYVNNPQRIYQLVDKIVLPHFDFTRMAKLALGKYWRRADSKQRQRFISEFRKLLVHTYSSSLAEYADRTIRYLPDTYQPGDVEATVKSEVDEPGGFPIPVNYRAYLHNGKWLVYDVTIDSVSLVTNYRSSFASEIRKHGIDGLIEKLAERNEQSAQN